MTLITLNNELTPAPLTGLAANKTARAFVLGAGIAALGNEALAAGSTDKNSDPLDVKTPIKKLTKPVCMIYNALTGTLGIAFLLVLIAFAGFKFAMGNSKATSQAVAAVVGAIIVFGARSLLNLASTQGNLDSSCGDEDPSKQ